MRSPGGWSSWRHAGAFVGSDGFVSVDAALVGYPIGLIFGVFGVVYRYAVWDGATMAMWNGGRHPGRRTARSQATVKLLEALGSELMVHQPIDATAFATATKLSVRDVAPGAITAAVIWQMLQLFGTAYVANVVKDAGLA